MKPKTGAKTGAHPRRAWLRAVEDASLARGDPAEDEAATCFDALEPVSARMALVREIVATRSRELTLAYRNVVAVLAGYKAARADDGGGVQVRPEPCVIFAVKRKWPAAGEGPAEQALPGRLLCFGGDGGARRPYAVPTDVQPAAWFYGASTRSTACVNVDDTDPRFRLPGTLTCGVRLHGAAGAPLALSAMHVLSPAARQALPAAGAELLGVAAGPAVRGHSAAWGGHMDGDAGTAFDAQLAEIDDTVWFNAAFAGLELAPGRPYVATPREFDELAAGMRFQILAPDNHPQHGGAAAREPMLAQYVAEVPAKLPIVVYGLRLNGLFQKIALSHRELLVLHVLESCPPPLGGDSGSAVVTWWPDGRMVLAGMFIASHDNGEQARVCYVVPAWQLFHLDNWHLPPGTALIEPSFTLP
jgi:hypothetical protein